MWMTEYIQEIQRQLITKYAFKRGGNDCPQDVPDGAYPMIIEGQLDLVIIRNGGIWCCNFINEDQGLNKFQGESIKKRMEVKP